MCRRRWSIFLAVGIVLLPVALPAGDPAGTATDADPLDALREQYRVARAAGDLTEALAAAEEAYGLTAPPHVESLYAITAVHAARGDEDEMYAWLQRTLDAGFWDFRRLIQDDDFAAYRDDPRFETTWRAAWTKQYIAMLEREERDGFQLPDRVMDTLDVRPGERVADVGAGSGYFTVRLARAVGPDGTVLATDIREPMIAHLDRRLHDEGLANVRTRLTRKDDPMLEDGAYDTILLVDVWHYIRDPEFARKLSRGLAPGGRLVIIDYRPKPWDERPWGPPPVQQTPREEVDAHFAEAGLAPVRVHDFLPEQYFVEYEVR